MLDRAHRLRRLRHELIEHRIYNHPQRERRNHRRGEWLYHWLFQGSRPSTIWTPRDHNLMAKDVDEPQGNRQQRISGVAVAGRGPSPDGHGCGRSHFRHRDCFVAGTRQLFGHQIVIPRCPDRRGPRPLVTGGHYRCWPLKRSLRLLAVPVRLVNIGQRLRLLRQSGHQYALCGDQRADHRRRPVMLGAGKNRAAKISRKIFAGQSDNDFSGSPQPTPTSSQRNTSGRAG